MGLFDIFDSQKRRHEAVFGRRSKIFKGAAKELAETLIRLWNEYRRLNPNFDPKEADNFRAAEGYEKAFRWICLQIGYDDSSIDNYCGQASLGDLALLLLKTDLWRGSSDLKKFAREVVQIHRCFLELLPDQMGNLEKEKARWQEEIL